MGRYLRKRLGIIGLDVVGRLTRNTQPFELSVSGDASDGPTHADIDIGPLGRRSEVARHRFELRLGYPDPEDPSQLGRLWPE